MCGINVIINGSSDKLMMMQNATKHRGLKNYRYRYGKTEVSFDWLPITDSYASPKYVSGRWTVWLNGFISNYLELADKYNIRLETSSDTEFLAKFMHRFDSEKLSELSGFFAVFALEWENIPHTFTDRYGIKQLYEYHDENGTHYISSEVKGILAAVPGIKLDDDAVKDWKYSLGIMTEHTIFSGIKRIQKLPFIMPKKIDVSYEYAKLHLKKKWMASISRNRCKNPNLQTGVFLSGGIDSGMIAKWIQPHYSFSMDYVYPNFSEIDNIKLNSTSIHIAMICNQDLFDKYASETMFALDDLKAGSCYTNFALTELASKLTTVIYSGAGADEIFGGYPHRKDRPINSVINRAITWNGGDPKIDQNSEFMSAPTYNISHSEYDWKYLQGVLIVEDRIGGYHTMETRYPFLDNDFVDFALSLPDEYLENKRILKDISNLDPAVIAGKKMGFSNPFITNHEWAEFALDNLRL